MGNNLVYDGESGSFDEFEAAFKYDCIIYGWDDRKQVAAIELCLVGKAKKLFSQIEEADKNDIKKILECLKRGCVKSPEYYLNLFYSKQLKPDQKISDFCYEIEKLMDKALPNLDEDNRTRMLRSRLLSAVPEHIKSYLELLSDKKWKEIVAIFDKSVDYKEIYQGSFQIKEEVDVQRVEFSAPKFNGSCHFCNKFGHKIADCLARKNQVQRSNTSQGRSRNFEQHNGRKFEQKQNSYYNKRPINELASKYEPRNSEQRQNSFGKKEGYVIDAEIDVESDGSREANMIKCQNYFSTNTNTLNKLIRIESDVEFGGERFGLKFLADSGASASFISPDSLPKSLSKKIDVFLETGKQEKWLNLRKSNLTIKSALNSETVKTAVGTVRLRFKDWEGEHEFIFTKLSEPAILGIDFLTKFKANFDFTNQKITISDGGNWHQINTVQEIESNDMVQLNLSNKIIVKGYLENMVKII